MPNPNKKMMILPKGYLSWSAFSVFKRNREEYIRHYFYGEPNNFNSPSLEFGKNFAQHLEVRKEKNRECHPDPVVEMAIQSLPIQGISEFKIKADLPSAYGIVRLSGMIDQFDPKTNDFIEYKTGWRKWTHTMAQNHGQMKFYALMIWLNYNVVDNKKQLIWVETERGDDYVVRPTGRIVKFPVEITMSQLLKFSREVIDVAKEISELYTETINKSV
jgi:hypothetical protein